MYSTPWPGPTDVADEEDLGVGGDVLCEAGFLVVEAQGLVLADGVGFPRGGGGHVEQVEPALGTDRDHKVLPGKVEITSPSRY